MITSPQLTSIMKKLSFTSYGVFGLDAEDTIRFGAWCHMWMQTEQASSYLLSKGAHDRLLTYWLSTPWGAEFWSKNKGIYDSAFVDHMTQLQRDLESTPRTAEDLMAGK